MITYSQREAIVSRFFEQLTQAQNQMFARFKTIISNKKYSDQELATIFAQMNFFDELNKAGFSTALENFMLENRNGIRDVLKLAKQKGVDITGISVDQLINLSNLDGKSILRRAEMFTTELQSEMAKVFIMDYPRKKLLDTVLPQIQEQLFFPAHWFNVAVEKAFDELAEVSLAKSLPDAHYELVHIRDNRNRKRCIEAMNIYAEKYSTSGVTIDEVNSGALGSEYTFLNKGGFNCRGFWRVMEA